MPGNDALEGAFAPDRVVRAGACPVKAHLDIEVVHPRQPPGEGLVQHGPVRAHARGDLFCMGVVEDVEEVARRKGSPPPKLT